MIRIESLILSVAMLLPGAVPLAAGAEAGDAEVDIEYAEHVPLAAHSLLLDAIRYGDRLLAAGERGHIVYSDDGGVTWQQAEVVPTRSTLTTLAVAGDRLWAAGHDTAILTSGDGGRNWTRQYFDPERQQPVMDLHFFDADRGLAIGAYGLMLATRDGGRNWEDRAVNDEDDAHLNSVVELPNGTLLIAGEAGYSYRSPDGGETWESLELPYQGSMFRALGIGADCVMFVGLRGHAMTSCDEGGSWEAVATGSESTLIDGVLSGDRLLLVGNSGAILDRRGAGAFRAQTHSSGVDFSSILDLGDGRFLLIGEEGTYFYPEHAGEEPQP
jgi:photosystem II stability/assembly factor-like uncharacterized protein